jgi:hypothetical protein
MCSTIESQYWYDVKLLVSARDDLVFDVLG